VYKALGVLERGHIVETDRQGLVAGFVGQTAIKTAERIDEAMGGVLFIDEAYALSNTNGLQGDYGNEAIQTILKRMEDNRGEFFVFAAGYPGNMEKFLKANPGLSSRFDKTFHFEDYTETQLFQIAKKMIKDKGMRLSAKASGELKLLLFDLYKSRDKYFGNARTVRKIILELVKHQNLRYSKSPKENRTKQNEVLITNEDIMKLDIFSDNRAFQKQGIGYKQG
jgi:SpoVK/Ycf46/Vps4 family AAA+-type ATPase